jgi:hypothetical protein
MRSSVASRFRAFNEPIEGVVNFMYLDVKGLVTIGVGNLIDPMSVALALPFRLKSKPGAVGRLATRAEIEAEWKLIKGRTDLARLGHRACGPLTTLELDDTAINEIIRTRLIQNESFLKRQKPFLKFEEWPADAQMALLSMAWAMGPGFYMGWVNFHPACERMDFDQAAANCKINESGNPGVAHRSRANVHLFRNAAAVLAGEAKRVYRREELYYPRVLLKDPATTPR